MIDRGCSTADCEGMPMRMVRLGDVPDKGPWPYCAECAEVLSRSGDEDCGPFDPITDDMVERAAHALLHAEHPEASGWSGKPRKVKGHYRRLARAALTAAFDESQEPS